MFLPVLGLCLWESLAWEILKATSDILAVCLLQKLGGSPMGQGKFRVKCSVVQTWMVMQEIMSSYKTGGSVNPV